MAKTNFVDNGVGGVRGTKVVAAFLNAIFNSNGGHRHTGQNDDGFAQKISLTTEVEGVLPLENMTNHTHNGTQAHLINLASHITGKLSLLNQWASIEEFEITFSGFESPAPVVACIGFLSDTIIVPVYGNPSQSVNLRIAKVLMAGFSGTSNAVTFSAAAGSIPAVYRPVAGDKSISLPVIIDGSLYPGAILIGTDGRINVMRQPIDTSSSYVVNTFANTGTKGLDEVEYTVISAM